MSTYAGKELKWAETFYFKILLPGLPLLAMLICFVLIVLPSHMMNTDIASYWKYNIHSPRTIYKSVPEAMAYYSTIFLAQWWSVGLFAAFNLNTAIKTRQKWIMLSVILTIAFYLYLTISLHGMGQLSIIPRPSL